MLNSNLTSKSLLLAALISFTACKQKETTVSSEETNPKYQLSLAQWSMNKQIRNGSMDPFDFAKRASEMGFEGIEYVNQLYRPHFENAESPEAGMQSFIEKSLAASEAHNVRNVLIMIDGEGNLSAEDEAERNQAVENHKRWVDAAAALGCHSIRVNLHGSSDPDTWLETSVLGMKALGAYALDKGINIIVENHGGLSSNAAKLSEVLKAVDMPNCGSLPDFGNFCMASEYGSTGERTCTDEYDKYLGVEELMPYAKAVSAKTYTFDEQGNERDIDYAKMMQIVKASGYEGFIGVEFEGDELTEEEGIIASKALIEKSLLQ